MRQGRLAELYQIIASAREEIERIRTDCQHPETREGLFAVERTPNIHKTKICNLCDAPVKETP